MLSRAFRPLPHRIKVYIGHNTTGLEKNTTSSEQTDVESGEPRFAPEICSCDTGLSIKPEVCDEQLDHDRNFVSSYVAARQRWSFLSNFSEFLGNKVLGTLKCHSLTESSCNTRNWVSPYLRRVLKLLVIALMLLGLLHFVALTCGVFLAFFPDEINWRNDRWNGEPSPATGVGRWQGDVTTGTRPTACHSHNDYWREKPLFSAIEAGCTGVESDVWLLNDDLFVGHHISELAAGRTLQSLYVQPLLRLLEERNRAAYLHQDSNSPRKGVFIDNPRQTLVLLIDFKNEGDLMWNLVNKQLEPLRQMGYLSYFDGRATVQAPITVVVSGDAPFNRIVANSTYRDIFFDAPLDFIGSSTKSDGSTSNSAITNPTQDRGHSDFVPLDPSSYSLANSYYASVSFKRTIGWSWRSGLTDRQVRIVRAQIAGAHARGLKVRYWGVPQWPRRRREYLWRFLIKEGVDVLNVDDLGAATRTDWRTESNGTS